MLYIITSSYLNFSSIMNYQENFILSVLHSSISKVHRTRTKIFQFDIYTQDSSSPELEDCSSEDGINYDIHEHSAIIQSLDEIAEMFMDESIRQQQRTNDLQEEIIIASCCSYGINSQVVKYLNRYFTSNSSELKVLNLYQQLRIPSSDKMSELLRSLLGTNFIYPDDPISFGYALESAIERGI